MTMASMGFGKPKTKQDYGTPANFINAVEKRFGKLDIDLAAHAGNRKCEMFFGPGSSYHEDSLEAAWCQYAGLRGWLNPEFAAIGPWAKKCKLEAREGFESLLLVPASVGSNWFSSHVAPAAVVYYLNGRMSFDGNNLYPKDCLLAHFYREAKPRAFIWKWGKDELMDPWGIESAPTGSQAKWDLVP